MAEEVIEVPLMDYLEERVKERVDQKEWMKERTFKRAENIEEVMEFVDKAIVAGKCALDMETTGLSTRVKNGVPVDKIVGVCMSYDSKYGLYIPVNHVEPDGSGNKPSQYNLSEKEVLAETQRLCTNCVTIYHNAKFDLMVLRNHGVTVRSHNDFEDTLLLAYLYDSGQKNIKLKQVAPRLLGQPMLEFEDIAGSSSNKLNLVCPTIAYIYGGSDAVCTLDLYNFLIEQEIVQSQHLIYGVEKRVTLALLDMESNLIKIDRPYLENMKEKAEKRLKEIENEIYELADKVFNIGSTQQLGKILFDELGYRYPMKKKTASGQYMTDSATLEKISDQYPVVKKVVEYRKLGKLLNTYINNLIVNCDENECVKLNFKQTGTDTGRFSSPGGKGIDVDGQAGVNVQAIPKEVSEEGSDFDLRKSFIARPGHSIIAIDYENEEMRIATNLSGETAWIKAINEGIDFHTATAAIIAGKDPTAITKAERKIGKCVARGTLIASSRGWLPIEDLNERDSVITHTGKLKKISKIWDMGIKPGVIVTTKSGHKITCGLNHQFLDINEKWIKAKDLKAGQVIKTVSCEKMSPNKIQKIHFNIWNKGNNNTVSRDLPYVEVSPLWARLMGYVLGDGSANLNAVNIVCSKDYEDVKEDIFNTARKLGLNPIIKIEKGRLRKDGTRSDPLYKIHLGSRILVRFFREIGFTGRREWKEENKKLGRFKSTKIFRIPPIIFKSPKRVSREFLRGLFETDGYVSKKSEISVTTKDIELAEDIQLLVAQFGIKASIMSKLSKRYNRYYHTVFFSVTGAKIFEKEIGFISKYKKDRLHTIAHNPNARIFKTKGSFKVKWESEIKEMKYVDEISLMDLTVDNDHTYVAQGLVTHNTVNFLALYLGGPLTLSTQAKVTLQEAKKILATFFAGVPKLKEWIDKEIKRAQRRKFVKTVFGRTRLLSRFYGHGDRALESHGDRCSINTQVQGAAADIMKAVMSKLHAWIQRNNLQDDIKVLITMHDELVFEIPTEKIELYVPEIAKIMMFDEVITKKLEWEIPLTVDIKYGKSWRVKNGFFKDFPELKERLKEPLREFSPLEKSDDSVLNEKSKEPVIEIEEQGSSEILPVEAPSQDVEMEEKSEDLGNENVSSEIPSVDDKPQDIVFPLNQDSDGSFIYQIRDRRKVTLRWLNDILNHLLEESSKISEDKRQILKIKDFEGNSLLVSEFKIHIKSFLILAKFFGI